MRRVLICGFGPGLLTSMASLERVVSTFLIEGSAANSGDPFQRSGGGKGEKKRAAKERRMRGGY